MQTPRKILYIDNDLRRQNSLTTEITQQRVQELLDIRATLAEGGEFIDITKYSAIFFHINNPEYDFFYYKFKGALPLVKFSGGYSGSKQVEGNECLCNASDVRQNISRFLLKYKKTGIIDLKVLIDVDPLLEANLALLHSCMTPEGLSVTEKIFEEVHQFSEDKEKIQAAFTAMQAAMASPRAGGFDGGYMNTLRDLRQALLSS